MSPLSPLALAGTLSQWQILDMVHYYRTGRAIQWCELTRHSEPRHSLWKMMNAGILARGGQGRLVAGPRFTEVFEALQELGRISRDQLKVGA